MTEERGIVIFRSLELIQVVLKDV